SWALRVDAARDDVDGRTGFDFLIDVTFPTVCRAAPRASDVVSVGESFFEVAADNAAPDVDGRVQELRVRSLSDVPTSSSALVGLANFPSTSHQPDPGPPVGWVSFDPTPTTLPAAGVSTSAKVRVLFSEPMDPASISPFDNFFLVRGDSSAQVIATN